jgi:arylsulfatase A-like enzyme
MTLALSFAALLACSDDDASPSKDKGAGSVGPGKPEEPSSAPAPDFDYAARAKDLNVIWIDVDSLRFDRTGAGGSALTPNIDALAKEAVVFTNTTSAASWTVPSTMAMFTARWPTRHGVINKLAPNPEGGEPVFARLADDIPTLPESLVAAGWTAAAFTGGAGTQAKFGYGRGFSTYLDDKPFAGMDYSGPPAAEWLKANKDGHFFLFFHGYDVHGQHPLVGMKERDAVPDYQGALDGTIEEQAKLREQGLSAIVNPGDAADLTKVLSAEDTRFLAAVYDAKVKEADARVGQFLATVKEQGLFDKSIVILLADHGEEFMEHGYIDHGATICEHQVHVPMMIRFPGGEGARVVSDPVRSIDVLPTVLDALGVKPPEGIDGRSLIPLIRGEDLELPVFTESDYRLFVHLRATRVGDQKLILDLGDGQKTLYDVAKDPGEANDLSGADARTTYELEQSVRKWMGEMDSDPNRFLGVKEEHIKIF